MLAQDVDVDLARVIDELLLQVPAAEITAQDVGAFLLALPPGRRFEAYVALVGRGVPTEVAQMGYHGAANARNGDVVVTAPAPPIIRVESPLRRAWPWLAAVTAIGVGFAVGRAAR